MAETMKRFVLASRPEAKPTPDNFRLEEVPLPKPGDGQVLLRALYMSLDPYMRGRMSDAKSYAEPVAIGARMIGAAVGEVIESGDDGFKPGDIALGFFGWGTHGLARANELKKIDPEAAPISTALGVLGMPGFTAWYGLNAVGEPKVGETLVVAAATGPVGSMVGQLARIAGLRTIGIAGGADKCAHARDDLRFDQCLDHKAVADRREMRAALSEACPDGIDIYFENVGGKVVEGVLPLMNIDGRIPLCGSIAWYNATGKETEPEAIGLSKVWRTILVNQLRVQGFIISNHYDRFGAFLREVAPLVKAGEIAYREDITEGFENAPDAFIRMLDGGNFGKTLVKIG